MIEKEELWELVQQEGVEEVDDEWQNVIELIELNCQKNNEAPLLDNFSTQVVEVIELRGEPQACSSIKLLTSIDVINSRDFALLKEYLSSSSNQVLAEDIKYALSIHSNMLTIASLLRAYKKDNPSRDSSNQMLLEVKGSLKYSDDLFKMLAALEKGIVTEKGVKSAYMIPVYLFCNNISADVVNKKDKHGYNALYYAIRAGNINNIAWFLAYGALPDLQIYNAINDLKKLKIRIEIQSLLQEAGFSAKSSDSSVMIK